MVAGHAWIGEGELDDNHKPLVVVQVVVDCQRRPLQPSMHSSPPPPPPPPPPRTQLCTLQVQKPVELFHHVPVFEGEPAPPRFDKLAITLSPAPLLASMSASASTASLRHGGASLLQQQQQQQQQQQGVGRGAGVPTAPLSKSSSLPVIGRGGEPRVLSATVGCVAHTPCAVILSAPPPFHRGVSS